MGKPNNNKDIDLLDDQDTQANPEPEQETATAPEPEAQPTAPAKPQPVSGELHVCSDGETAVATFGVVRWKGEPEELACKRCLGPLTDVETYRVLNPPVSPAPVAPTYGM